MKKALSWLFVILAVTAVVILGAVVMSLLNVRGNLPMAIVVGCAMAVGSYVYRRLSHVFNSPTLKELKNYPIISDSFPIDHMFIHDTVVFADGRSFRYTGCFEGKYGFDGVTFMELAEDEVMNQATELGNSRVMKWRRQVSV